MTKTRRDLEAIADDIVAALSSPGHSSSEALAKWQLDTREKVLRSLNFFILYYTEFHHRYSRANQVAVAKSAKRIGDLIASLEREMNAAPGTFVADMFQPVQLRGKVLTTEEEEYSDRELAAALLSFNDRLSQLRKDCEWFSRKPTTARGPEADRAKKLSAMIAFGLVEFYSKHILVGTPVSPFPAVARLVHEAMTGMRNANLMRACQRLLEQRLGDEEFKTRLEAKMRARLKKQLQQKYSVSAEQVQAVLEDFSRLILEQGEEEKDEPRPWV